MTKKKKDFIDQEDHRYGLFFSDKSNDTDIEYCREWLKTDNIQEVFLYKINVIESKSHTLYNQSKPTDKKFFPPVKISCFVHVDDVKQQYYGNGGGIVRDDTGNIALSIFIKELEERNIEILRGDIIKYNMSGEKNRYYEVESANNVLDTSNLSRGGFKNFVKKVIGVPVKADVIDLIEN